MRIACILIAFACVGARPAWAQQDSDEAEVEAEELFVEGRELLKQGQIDKACARFKASHKRDGAPGTLLNMALCREQQGKVASAWSLYLEAAIQAGREGQARHEAVARERALALEVELPRLIIEVGEASQVSGLSVERDGMAVDATLFGRVVYVDPGWHRVVAQAPGYKEFVTEVAVDKGEETSVAIPVLQVDSDAQAASEQPAVQMTRWTKGYGNKIAAADGISLVAIGSGLALVLGGGIDGELGAAGVTGYVLMGGGILSLLFTPALIHNSQGNYLGAWKSIGVRVGPSLLGLMIGGDSGWFYSVPVLFLGGVALDWLVFAKVDVNKSLPVTPYVAPPQHRGAMLGLTGRF